MVEDWESRVRLNHPFEKQEKIRTSLMANSNGRRTINQTQRALPRHQASTSHLPMPVDNQARKNLQNILIRLVVKMVMSLGLDLRMQMKRNKARQSPSSSSKKLRMLLRPRYLPNWTYKHLYRYLIIFRSIHGRLKLEVNRQICIISHLKIYYFNYNSKTKLQFLIELTSLLQELVV